MELTKEDLCCIYNTPFTFAIKKKDNNIKWYMNDITKVLDYYNTNFLDENGPVKPLQIAEGGISWNGNEDSTMKYFNTVDKNRSWGVYSIIDRQLRIGNYHSSLDWPTIFNTEYQNWNDDICNKLFLEEKILVFRAKCNPSIQMVINIILSFIECGYELVYTKGITYRKNKFFKDNKNKKIKKNLINLMYGN